MNEMRRLINIMEGVLFEYKTDITVQKQGEALARAARGEGKDLQPLQVVQALEKMDPTKKKNYMMWIIKQYMASKMRLEDYPRVHKALSAYHSAKPQLPQEYRDIGKFDLHKLEELVDSFAKTDSEVSKTADFEHIDDMEILYSGPLGLLAIPKTQAASCELGSGTKWCTAARDNNMFDQYSSPKSPLYVWIQKPGGDKYQFWVGRTEFGAEYQFMDDKDIELGPDKINEFRKHPVVGKLIDKLVQKLGSAYVRGEGDSEGEQFMQFVWDFHPDGFTEWEKTVQDRPYDFDLALQYALELNRGWPELDQMARDPKKFGVDTDYGIVEDILDDYLEMQNIESSDNSEQEPLLKKLQKSIDEQDGNDQAILYKLLKTATSDEMVEKAITMFDENGIGGDRETAYGSWGAMRRNKNISKNTLDKVDKILKKWVEID